MAPAARKREGRENRETRGPQYFDVGVQGRKTGVTLKDTGRRDEHGLEPISGIFSSPERSPPKRSARKTGSTLTDSESMDIQESSIADLTTSAHILQNNRTKLPPPRSRSPMKTALGSSPRRHTSVGPRAQSLLLSSPVRAVSYPVSRRLDFEEDSNMQEPSALSGSGQPRGKRSDIYDVEQSPNHVLNSILDESMVQQEITANEDSEMMDGIPEDTFMGGVGEDSVAGTEIIDSSIDVIEEEEEEEEEPEEPEVVVKQPLKRGKKRKSEVLEPSVAEAQVVPKAKKQAVHAQKVKKAGAPPSRRSNRISDVEEGLRNGMDGTTDTLDQIEQVPIANKRRGRPPKANAEEPSITADESLDISEQIEQAPVAAKRRGRPSKSKPLASKPASATKARQPEFKKPDLPVPGKSKAVTKSKSKNDAKTKEKHGSLQLVPAGRLVDALGKPLAKADVDQMSMTSTGSRFGRGRQLLSVYRELGPNELNETTKSGRHRVAPVDFWKNEKIVYSNGMDLEAVVRNETLEPAPLKRQRPKGRKRALTAIEEENEDALEDWEADEGFLVGEFRDFNPETEVTSTDLLEDTIGWAQKGINPVDVADASFKFIKLGSAGTSSFLSWGFIELKADQMKRTKNSRRMHMVFHVTSGAVEVKVHDNEFTVHRGGVWQVPRGNTYSIRNVGSSTTRIFFSQAFEKAAEADE